jgi:hypothetical protein
VHLSDVESVPRTPEIAYFEEVVGQLGLAFKRHVKGSYDAVVHLRNELPITEDGHRPVNERFRTMSDEMLLRIVDELQIPSTVVSGGLVGRLQTITALHGLPTVLDVDEAIAVASAEYGALDVRSETQRAPMGATR